MSQTKAQLISDLVQALNFTGTSSAPANGVYLSAANTIKLSTNSNPRITIDSSGNASFAEDLYVGTSTALFGQDKKVQIASTGADAAVFLARFSTTDNVAAYLHFAKSSNGSLGQNGEVVDGELLGRIYFSGDVGNGLQSGAYIESYVDGSVTTNGAGLPGELIFKTAANASSSPTAALTLAANKNATFTGHINLPTGYSLQWSDSHERIEQSDGKIEFFTGNSQKMTLSSDNLGIGTDSPRRHFHIHNSASATVGMMLTNADTGEANDSQGFQFKVGSDKHAEISQQEDSYIQILTDGDNAMRITNDQKVLIGTTTSNASDTFTILDAGNAFMSLRSDTEADGRSQVLDFAIGTADRSSSNLVSTITASIPTGAAAGNHLQGYLAFATNSGDSLSERVRITETGTLSVKNVTYLSNSATITSRITLNSENASIWTGTRELVAFDLIGNGADHRTGTLSIKCKKASGDAAPTEMMRIDGVHNLTQIISGNLDLNDGDLKVANGHGIDFSASESGNVITSGSILDDYEEGIYTPVVNAPSGSWTLHTSYNKLSYTKIGRMVHVSGYISIASESSPNGNIAISLPFTVGANTGSALNKYSAVTVSLRSHGSTGITNVIGAPQPTNTFMNILSVAADGTHTWMDHTDVDTEWNIRIGGSFYV